MAKIERANINGRMQSAVNVSGIVGFKGANFRDDVMLIQGLLNYIANGLHPGAVGLGGDYKIPEITGVMDADTYSAIGAFQINNARQLLMQTFDGRIHPASYKNRRLRSNAKQMSIVLLHITATDAALMNGDYDYQSGMAKMNQELAFLIDRMMINS
jgi:hypothetical protein